MNPIMQKLGQPTNSVLGMLSAIKNQDPNKMMGQLMQNNSQFRSFVEQNKGLSPDQIARKYGVDINRLKSLI